MFKFTQRDAQDQADQIDDRTSLVRRCKAGIVALMVLCSATTIVPGRSALAAHQVPKVPQSSITDLRWLEGTVPQRNSVLRHGHASKEAVVAAGYWAMRQRMETADAAPVGRDWRQSTAYAASTGR